MALTATALNHLQPKDKPYKKYDTKGLFILVRPNGRKYWRLKYTYSGKEKLLSLGIFPAVSLAKARARRSDAEVMLADGLDPAQQRKADKMALDGTFGALAKEWFEKITPIWTPGHARTVRSRLDRDVLPWLRDTPIKSIEPLDVLQVLRRVEARGAIESAHRIKTIISQVFRYGVAVGLAKRDPTPDLKGALPPASHSRMAAVTDPKKVGVLLRAIRDYQGGVIVRAALQLSAYLFPRPGELRHAEWQEIDLDAALWTLPAGKMKSKREHVVPLPLQALSILKELQAITGSGRYVFPSLRGTHRYMSENAVRVALRSLGYDNQTMTPHGFRSTASTLLNGAQFDPDWIEMQLAHVPTNRIRGIYNRALYLPQRTRMMQNYADLLDGLCQGGDVVQIRARRG